MSFRPMRHFGRSVSTNARLIILAKDNPQNPGHALVVKVDALPESFREYLINRTSTVPAQQTMDLYKYLEKEESPDSDVDMVTALHRRRYIHSVSVDDVLLTPIEGQTYPLSQFLKELANQESEKAIKEEFVKQTQEDVDIFMELPPTESIPVTNPVDERLERLEKSLEAIQKSLESLVMPHTKNDEGDFSI